MTARVAQYLRTKIGDVTDFEYAAVILQRECQGSKHHQPKPLMVRSYDLAKTTSDGALAPSSVAKATDPVLLCSTCHDNLAVFLAMMASRENSSGMRRDFSNTICTLGDRAWEHRRQEATHGE